MAKPIDEKLLQERARRQAALNEVESVIIDRIQYVLEQIYACFHRKLDNWWFPDAPENSIGQLNDALGSTVEYNCSNLINDATILLKCGSEWGLESEFPIEWLYEDFEEELVKGREAYLKAKEDKKANEKIRKEKAKAAALELKERAKKKLTPEERKALGIK